MSPPRIMFDDGSRVMEDAAVAATATTSPSSPTVAASRGSVPLHIYYEIDRVASEVVTKLDWTESTSRGRLLQTMSDIDLTTESSSSSSSGSINNTNTDDNDDGFLCKVALQFPDELLCDSASVSWLLEDAITIAYKTKLMKHSINTMEIPTALQLQLIEEHLLHRHPLLFILGDASPTCCPDEVGAEHLYANVIVHYGYACLAPTESIPVVYAFGISHLYQQQEECCDDEDHIVESAWKECVQMMISNECLGEAATTTTTTVDKRARKLLLLYEVRYHHAMNELMLEFEKLELGAQQLEVVLGTIPKQQLASSGKQCQSQTKVGCGSGTGCDGGECTANSGTVVADDGNSSQSCCANDNTECCGGDGRITINCDTSEVINTTDNIALIDELSQNNMDKRNIPRRIGGLEIPEDLDLSQCSILYIGDDLDVEACISNECIRLLLILLRCNSPDGPKSIISFSPMSRRLTKDVLNSQMSITNDTTPSTVLSRMLGRRYFLINKAKLATTIAILIGTTSNSYSVRRQLALTRQRIQATGRTAYTFSVGKLSTAGNKLANFAEIDCYVLIACGESVVKFMMMERQDVMAPVLTPFELDIALGHRTWDGYWSADFGDMIRWTVNDKDYDDAPFFSMITGKYEASNSIQTTNTIDLNAFPGQGKLIEYSSEAGEYLKKRNYRGLEAKVGETAIKVAVLGKVGIASDYSETTT
jgi:diphthamide biosynthesis protein 2